MVGFGTFFLDSRESYLLLDPYWLNLTEYFEMEEDAGPSWWTAYEECPLMHLETTKAKVRS